MWLTFTILTTQLVKVPRRLIGHLRRRKSLLIGDPLSTVWISGMTLLCSALKKVLSRSALILCLHLPSRVLQGVPVVLQQFVNPWPQLISLRKMG